MASISDKGWDLGGYLREQREHARLSVRQLANLAGVSNPYLSQVERGLRKPSAEVLQQIARGLRISAEVLYVRAGILDSEGRPDVEAAVNADPELNPRQRRALLDIYSSFRAENRRADEAVAAIAAEAAAAAAAAAAVDAVDAVDGPEVVAAAPAAVPRRRPVARVRSAAKTAKAATRTAGRATRPVATSTITPTPAPDAVADGTANVNGTAPANGSPATPAAGRVPRKRTSARTATRATARSTKAASRAAAAGNETTPPDPGGAPDAHL